MPPKTEVETPVTQPADRMYKIQLEENDAIPPGGLAIGHNGDAFLLRPGIPTLVPRKLLEILNNAKMEVPDVDPNTRQVIGWKTKLKYPYQRLST